MGRVRIIYKSDKTVAIIHPALKSRQLIETEAQWLDRVFTKAMQGDLHGLSYDDIDQSDLPQSRDDRDAWEGEKGIGVFINQVKARKIRNQRARMILIESEKNKILEEQAIASLKAKGKL